ncbi:DMT family transporter [Granulosicoccus antarcticus]|uniref:EamA domain-containing protein n=1 Tax=Granulosicoccus antarcticus IMCC3135 TaxID=1192854 RepID=A0A2Z2NMA8_9GAMM|nr:EamA family transporter [Granulosicoccus antarcticus]ASJ70918.1 hypothetical protein IMCC3135_04025 [Granulosicoccus antarcticus IMCC3135]
MNRQSLTGIILILCAAMLWGTTGTAQTFAPLTLSSYWVGSMRLLVAASFFLLWLSLRNASALQPSRLRQLPWMAITLAAVGMAVYNLAFFAGIRATGVALGTAMALGSGPVWAGFLQIVVTRQKPSGLWWAALSICVLGLVMTTMGSQGSLSLPASGIALCLLSGLSYAVYALATKQIVASTPPEVATASVFLLAALIALPAAGLLAGKPMISTGDVVVMLWLGVVATGVAYLLFTTGLKFVSSATGVALALAEPVTAVVLAVLIVGERPASISYAGLVLMLLGLGILVKSEVSGSDASG